MVISMSLTILESSTMTVFTVPSNMRIFRGLCFFLYSKVSYETKDEWLTNLLESNDINGKNEHPHKNTACISSSSTQISHQTHFFISLCTYHSSFCSVLKLKAISSFYSAFVSQCNSPHSLTCSSPGPFQHPARCLSLGLHRTEKARSRWL